MDGDMAGTQAPSMAPASGKRKNILLWAAVAIVIIVVVVFVVVPIITASLFSVGAFNGAATLPSACIAAGGYLCTLTQLHNGVLTLTFGQDTGVGLNNVTLYLTSPNVNLTSSNAALYPRYTLYGSIPSGASIQANLTGGSGTNVLPTHGEFSGELWIGSYNSKATPPSYMKVAVVTVTAS